MLRFKRTVLLSLWMTAALTGCLPGNRLSVLPHAKHPDALVDAVAPDQEARTARMQRPDTDVPSLPPIPPSPNQLPPTPTMLPASPNPSPPSALLPVNIPAARDALPLRVSVRAWVNGRPIFEDEVRTEAFVRMGPPQGGGDPTKVMNERLNQALDKLVERELLFQDAYKKLEGNKKVLDQLNQAASKEFERKLKSMLRANKVKTVEEFRETIKGSGVSLETMRRMEERDFIANEYIRNRVFSLIPHAVSYAAIREYYDQHLNEFQSLDRVEWQDIFIAVGPKNSSFALARTAAETLLDRLRRGEPFEALLKYDDGASLAYRNGFGEGNRRGEIRPAELENHLFGMKEGEIGPLVELPTGIHIFRLAKREFAGQQPFSDKIQEQISRKLREDVADREYRRIIRDLKARSIVEINAQP